MVEGSQEEIQNLPSLPEPEPQVRPAFFCSHERQMIIEIDGAGGISEEISKKRISDFGKQKTWQTEVGIFFFNLSSERFVKF